MLYGKAVYLRAMRMEDLSQTLIWRNDLGLKSITMSHPFPVTSEKEVKWYEDLLIDNNNTRVYFSVCRVSDDELIGVIFLNNIDWINRTCFLGGLIGDKGDQGKGYGKEAVSLIISYAFEFLNLHKVYAYVLSDHYALKTWLSNGAIIEGTLIDHFWNGLSYHDVCILAWKQRTSASLTDNRA